MITAAFQQPARLEPTLEGVFPHECVQRIARGVLVLDAEQSVCMDEIPGLHEAKYVVLDWRPYEGIFIHAHHIPKTTLVQQWPDPDQEETAHVAVSCRESIWQTPSPWVNISRHCPILCEIEHLKSGRTRATQ